MKKIVHNVLWWLWKIRQDQKVSEVYALNELIVIDIDNTLTYNAPNEPIDHVNSTPRKGMIKFAKDCIENGKKVIYLSARDFRLYKSTINWLMSHGVYSDNSEIVLLVPTSMSKVVILEKLLIKNQCITFIDDLSYNHENGNVKYYDNVRSILQSMPIKLLSVEFINSKPI